MIIFLLILLVGAGSYLAYRKYMPEVIAEAITSEHLPTYLPERIQKKVKKIRTPINESANAVIVEMHKSKITLDQILEAINNVTEEDANALLDSLNTVQIQNPEQVFDMAKKQFPVNFDVEVFRKPYKDKVSMKLIKKGLAYANRYKRNEEMDFESARSIAKSILIQKEKEFLKSL